MKIEQMSQIIISDVKNIKCSKEVVNAPTSGVHQKLINDELKLYVMIDILWEMENGLKEADLKEALKRQEEKVL